MPRRGPQARSILGLPWTAASWGRYGGPVRRLGRIGTLVAGAVLLAGCAATGAPTPGGPSPTAPGTSAPDHAPIGATETARVIRVVDGDTIVIDRGRGDERLRYIGIDTPESVKPESPVELMGREASAANAALVEGREVVLEADVSDRDRFDRLLRYVWLREDGTWRHVNLELVRQGYAQVATYPPDVRWRDELADAQRVARAAGAGLWGLGTPVP
jgi:micrococcal nuclease